MGIIFLLIIETEEKTVSGVFVLELKQFPKYLAEATMFPEYYLFASFLFFSFFAYKKCSIDRKLNSIVKPQCLLKELDIALVLTLDILKDVSLAFIQRIHLT